MKITDTERNICSIIDIRRGKIAPSFARCTGRYSDCFAYVLSGRAEYIWDNVSHPVAEGDILYLSHNSSYNIKVEDKNYTFIFIDFYFDNSDKAVISNEVYRSKGISLQKSNFEKLYSLWKTGDFSNKIYCRSIIYNIYSEIARSSFLQYVSRDRVEQIEQIVRYIYDNLADSNLSISGLSKMCGISEAHFRRIFSCIYHLSPAKFITAARIGRAKELLASEACSIAEISDQCGFQNHYYFSKVFKTETGMTPSGFRKLYAAKH